MIVDARRILAALAIGIGATLLMDLWNLFLKRAFGIPSLNYCLLGRWVRHMLAGTFRHVSITAAQPKRALVNRCVNEHQAASCFRVPVTTRAPS